MKITTNMEKLISNIRYYISTTPNVTPNDIINEIKSLIGGEAYSGEAMSIYGSMIDKVFTAMSTKGPGNIEHWTIRLL